MTVAEMLQAIEAFMDETEIRVCRDGTNEVRKIRRATYQPAKGDAPAFICLVTE